jgi:hypothetical protein
LNISRSFCVVVQRSAKLTNTEVESLLEIDKRALTPDGPLELFARDEFAWAAGEQSEYFDRVRTELQAVSTLLEFKRLQIKFERTELYVSRIGLLDCHNISVIEVARIVPSFCPPGVTFSFSLQAKARLFRNIGSQTTLMNIASVSH